MRVQLSEKSKAEFIELIAKDSITCWFEGDEFVMPSGQGKTAKGIVLGKLLVWQHQQSKVDELQKRVDEMQRISNEEDIAISKLHNYIAKLLEENKELKAENKKIGQALKGGEA